MSNFKSHVVAGISSFLLLYFIFFFNKFSTLAILRRLVCAIAGSVFPDIDTKSKGQLIFYFILLAVLVLLIILKLFYIAIVLCLLGILPILVPHRGIFHNLGFLTILIIIVAMLLISCLPTYKFAIMIDALFFYVGILSHLWLDFGVRKIK